MPAATSSSPEDVSWFSEHRITHVLFILGLGFLYIASSAGLIFFNKYLMSDSHFPYAVPLVMGHMVTAFMSLGCLFIIKPAFFPSLAAPSRRKGIKNELPWVALISLLFSGQLVLTNAAYLKLSMAFLQMMKESNIALAFGMSVLAGMVQVTYAKTAMVILIVIATSMTIRGELAFSYAGFFIQGFSQIFEVSKLVLQSLVLSGPGIKLDPLSYVLVVSPISAALLGIAGIFVFSFNFMLETPKLSEVVDWLPLLLLNSLLALLFNIIMAIYVKFTSAITLIFTGMVKDIMIVMWGHFFLHESVTTLQMCGFILQLALILVWSQMSMNENLGEKRKNVDSAIKPNLEVSLGSKTKGYSSCV